jgi:hypothetical protein
MAARVIAKNRTSSGTVPIKHIVAIIAHFTTMAATDTITITKGAGGAVIATLQPAANNQTVVVSFGSSAVATDDDAEGTVAQINFNGTAAGDCTVVGF